MLRSVLLSRMSQNAHRRALNTLFPSHGSHAITPSRPPPSSSMQYRMGNFESKAPKHPQPGGKKNFAPWYLGALIPVGFLLCWTDDHYDGKSSTSCTTRYASSAPHLIHHHLTHSLLRDTSTFFLEDLLAKKLKTLPMEEKEDKAKANATHETKTI